jgi:hypothetical protein
LPYTPSTDGFVGTLEVETRGVSRVWFGLTGSVNRSDWVKIGRRRAWFTISLETLDRPAEPGELELLLEALRSGLHVRVSHGGVAPFAKEHAGDSFEVDGVRILRRGLRF